MMVMLVLVGMFLFSGAHVASGGDIIDTYIDNSIINPAPPLSAPDILSPVGTINGIWTSSPFKRQKIEFTVAELCRVANPSRALGFLWYEWGSDFKIEVACHDKAKPQKSVRIYSIDAFVNADVRILPGFVKMGEIHAKALKLYKSEKQVVAALGVFAARQGANVIVIRTFSNPVTRGDSAVLGGGGANQTTATEIFNGVGGFGWTTSEQVYRSYVVAELYR